MIRIEQILEKASSYVDADGLDAIRRAYVF